MVSINFNANDVAPSTGFEALPAGDYIAIVESSEEKRTQKGDGSYLQFTFQIVEGDHANRKLWARMNIHNPSEEAQKIGRAELSSLCRAVGVLDLKDTSELHNKPLRIKVVQERRKDNGEITNKVKSYHAKEAQGAGVAGLVTGGSSKPAAGPARPAWATK